MDDQTVTVKIKVVGVEQVQQDLNNTKQKFNTFGEDLKNGLGIKGIAIGTALGQGIVNTVTTAIDTVKNIIHTGVDLIEEAVGSAAQLQQTGLAYEVMLGSAQKAQSLLKDISTFEISTSFDLTTLQNVGLGLITVGNTAEQVIPTMRMLSDVSFGNTQKFQSLAEVMGRVKENGSLNAMMLKSFVADSVPILDLLANKINAVGLANDGTSDKTKKLYDEQNKLTEQLNVAQMKLDEMQTKGTASASSLQAAKNSVNDYSIKLADATDKLKAFSRQTNLTSEDVKGLITSGAISYQDVYDAINMATEAGGRFYQGSERGSHTLLGLESSLHSVSEQFMNTLGGINSDSTLVKGGLLDNLQQSAQKFLDYLKDHQTEIQEFGATLSKFLGEIANDVLPKLIAHLPQLLTDITDFMTSVKNGIPEIKDRANELGKTLTNVKDVAGIGARVLIVLFDQAKTIIVELLDGIQLNILKTQQSWDQLTNNQADYKKSQIEINRLQKEMTSSLFDTGVAGADLLDKIDRTRGSTTDWAAQVRDVQSSFANMNINPNSFAGQKLLHMSLGGVAENGIIAGNDNYGDKQLIGVNSGEMIINRSDQQALFNFIKNIGNKPQQVINATFNNGNAGNHQTLNNFTNMLTNF